MTTSKHPDDQYGDAETRERMERGLRRALNTPPQPHGKNPKSASRRTIPKQGIQTGITVSDSGAGYKKLPKY
jgi:hypothetical protein